jgi:CMP-N-acetylneuraminic acid synthetase
MNQMEKILQSFPPEGRIKEYQKNIRLLAGKPLIYYKIYAARELKSLHDIIVSTDDDEIAKGAKPQGATIIKRPVELSRDTSPTIEAILHALEQCEHQDINAKIVILH